MAKVFIFLAPGFEEAEAIVPVDILRRGGLEVETVSIAPGREVTGSHGITVVADVLFADALFSEGDMLVLPGGPGTKNLNDHEELKKLIVNYNDAGKYLAAICAAPMILGELGLLKGKKAISYPGYEKYLLDAQVMEKEGVVLSENIITAKCMGVAMEFALKIVELLKGKSVTKNVASSIIM